MTTVPDTYTEWDLTVLNEHDSEQACEANELWHFGDEPAAWVTYWNCTPGCRCSGAHLLCDPCKNRVLESEHWLIDCTDCDTTFPGPLRKYMTRIEPLR